MLKPQNEDSIDFENQKTKDKRKNDARIQNLKDKIGILVETPLFINGELLDKEMFCQPDENNAKGARIL